MKAILGEQNKNDDSVGYLMSLNMHYDIFYFF